MNLICKILLHAHLCGKIVKHTIFSESELSSCLFCFDCIFVVARSAPLPPVQLASSGSVPVKAPKPTPRPRTANTDSSAGHGNNRM